MRKYAIFFAMPFLFAFSLSTFATNNNLDLTKKNKSHHAKKNPSWYISWGYNKDFWSNSDINISQPSLHNNFTVNNVRAGDDPEWNTGLFNKSLMGPQYNIRIGHYLNPQHTWGVELSFDHAKYNTNINQIANISGTVNGQPFNQNQVLTRQYFYYALHNGANLLMLNLVRRKSIFDFYRTNLEFALIGKIGAGVMLPHPENTIMGNTVTMGQKSLLNVGIHHGWWQFGGWTAGVEVGVQMLVHHRVYLELTDKEAVVTLANIQVYQGSASQDMWLNEVIGNVGVMI